MPPARKYAGPRRPGERSAKVKKSTYSYSRKAPGSKSRSNQNVTKLTTYSNKSENLKIQFREEFDFSNMGGKAGSSPCLIRVDMNNPFRGLSDPDPPNDETIMQIVGGLKNDSIDPIFSRASYNSKYNLTDRLESYAQEYRSCIVTSSTVTFNVRPKLNQVYNNSSNNSLVQYYINQPDPAVPGENQALKVMNPTATGDLYVWSVRQQNHSQLHDATNGVLPLTTLKEGVPGVRMTKLNVTPTSVKGCKFKLKYSPRSQYQIKDILDNKSILKCLDGTKDTPLALNPDQKRSFAYLGIGARIQGLDPDPSEGLGARALANCIVEAVIEYNLQFTERFNIDGNNEPTATRGRMAEQPGV